MEVLHHVDRMIGKILKDSYLKHLLSWTHPRVPCVKLFVNCTTGPYVVSFSSLLCLGFGANFLVPSREVVFLRIYRLVSISPLCTHSKSSPLSSHLRVLILPVVY